MTSADNNANPSSGPFTEAAVSSKIAEDAKSYRENFFSTSADLKACHKVLEDIAEKAPRLKSELDRKVTDGSPLQNLISGYCSRIGFFSSETATHVGAVIELTSLCADRLVENHTLTADQGADLCLAAVIHDFGKLYVDEKIIHKIDPFSADERQAMERHLTYSSEIARQVVPENTNIFKIVTTHHERLDGTGYPQGLKGEGTDLPTRDRILPIIDCIETITGGRGYQAAMSTHQALGILRNKDKFDQKLLSELEPVLVDYLKNRPSNHRTASDFQSRLKKDPLAAPPSSPRGFA